MKKKFHDQKPSGKDILRGFVSPQIRGVTVRVNTPKFILAHPLFKRTSKIMLAYFNIFQYMYGPTLTH